MSENRLAKTAAELLPGLALALALAFGGQLLADWLGRDLLQLPKSPISPIMLAILLGMLLRNTLGLPAWSAAGARFCLVRVLRLGIVLLGLRLSLGAAGTIGLKALPVIIGCVVSALLLVSWISTRMGLSDRLGTLIAAGTAICGATAIVALSPALRAREEETAYAVACISLFGMLAMLSYPFAAHWLFAGDGLQAGLFLGTAVHDTAQVVGSGLVYRSQYGDVLALDAATVTKLVRNLGMLVVIPLLGFLYHRRAGGETTQLPWYSMVPLFVLGFAGMCLLRTLGDLSLPEGRALGLFPAEQWSLLLSRSAWLAELCLAVAMAAVGMGTSLASLRRIGYRPLAVGLVSALLVGVVSYALVSLLYGGG